MATFPHELLGSILKIGSPEVWRQQKDAEGAGSGARVPGVGEPPPFPTWPAVQ